MSTIIDTEALVFDALRTVDDPEYPGLSIVDLGLCESISIDGTTALIELVPTFGGCPALAMIGDDVRAAVRAVDGIDSVDVHWSTSKPWTTDRMTATATQVLSSEFTVVLRRKDGTLRCPVCGSDTVRDEAMAGPTRCRSVAWCEQCRNPIEVFRA